MKDPVDVEMNIGVPESKNSEPALSECVVAFDVACRLFWRRMAAAVELDHEPCFRTIEVRDPTADRMLAMEAGTVETAGPNAAPYPGFHDRGSAPEIAGVID